MGIGSECHYTAWRVTYRPQSGTFLETPGGVLLAKLTSGENASVNFYDKRTKSYVTVSLDTLNGLLR
jgi:hypothetical protein